MDEDTRATERYGVTVARYIAGSSEPPGRFVLAMWRNGDSRVNVTEQPIRIDGRVHASLGGLVAKVTMQGWLTMSGQLMANAALFSREALAAERLAPLPPEAESKHWALVFGGILNATAAVEAFANEVLIGHRQPASFDEPTRKLIAHRWPDIERFTSLRKLDLARDYAGLVKLVPGESPYQEAQIAINLRDEITHFKTHEIGGTGHPKSESVRRLERAIQGRFRTGPFYSAIAPLFPNGCIGHGCVSWVVTSLREFLGKHCDDMGVARLELEARDFNPS